MAQDTPQDPQQDRPVSLDEFEEQRRQYYGIPKGLSVALRTQESGGKQYDKSGNVLTSPKNAKGRYQVLPDTAARYGLNADDPFENTEAAFRYMSDLHKKVDPNVKDPGERWASVVAGYHSGEGGLNKINKTGNMPATNDGLIKTDDYVANVMKRWQQHDAGDTGAPTAQPASQPEAAPIRRATPILKPGPQKTTARGPVLPKEGNPFAINQGATGFQQQAQAANARTGQISPEVVAQADAKARFNEQPLYKRVGQFAANQFAQGGQQAQQTLQNAVGALARGSARMMNPVGASVPPVDIRSAQGKAAQEATAQRLTREEQAFPNAGIKNENKDWADAGLDIAGGVLKAVPTMAAITAAGELVGPAAGLAAAGGSTAANADWANHPVKSALETAGSVALPYIGGKAGSKAAGLIAGRLSPGVAGALTGAFHTAGAGAANAVAPIAENVYEGKPIDWQRAATEAGIGVATGLPFAGAAAQEGRANANRTALNRAVQAGELAPVQGEGGTQIQRIPSANTPAYQGLVQEGQARGRAGIGALKQATAAEPQAAPVQPEAPAQATPSALPQDRLAGIRVLGEAERVPMRDRARAKSIVYSDENGVPQNVRVLLPEGMSLGDAKRVLRDARKYQAQQNAEAAPAQPEATSAPPENPRNRAISRGREIEQQARAEADAAIQEGRHDDARAALKRRLAALQDTRANIKRDTPGAVALRAQLGEQIFRTQEELRGLKTPAQRPVRPAPEVRPPGNEPTRDLTTPFPQAARVEPTTPFAQAEAPARKTVDLPAREQARLQAQEAAQAPVAPATPTPAAQRPATSANARRRYGRGMDEAVTVHFENQADALRFDASKRGRHAAIGPEADQVAREFGIDRREAAGAIYDWRRTVEAAAKSAKPGTDVPGPSFAEFVRARQQAAAQIPEAQTPQPPTGPLTEPTNRLQGAEYAGGELVEAPRVAQQEPVRPVEAAPKTSSFQDKYPVGAQVTWEQPQIETGRPAKRSSGTVVGHKVDPVTGETFAQVKDANGRHDFAGDINNIKNESQAETAPHESLTETPEAKPYKVNDQMARRRQEREAALKGPFGKFAEQARKFVGKEHTLASHPELRQLLDLPEMPDYKNKRAWTEATHDTMNALAALVNKPRSSEMSMADIYEAVHRAREIKARKEGKPVFDQEDNAIAFSPDLEKTIEDTITRYATSTDNYQNFIVDGRVDNILRRLDQQHERPLSKREASELQKSLISIADEHKLSKNYAENLWKYAQADAASRAQSRSSRATPGDLRAGDARGGASEHQAAPEAERATGTYGRDTGRSVSAEAPAPKSAPLSDYKRFENANKKAIDTLRSVKPEEAATPAGQRRVDALISRLRKSADQMGVDQKHVDAVVTEAQNAQMEAARAADAEARPSEATPAPRAGSQAGEIPSDLRGRDKHVQMTRDEFANRFAEATTPKPSKSNKAAIARYESQLEIQRDQARRIHETSVKYAINEGKPVPPEVLADYPDLQAKSAPPVAEMRPRAESEARAAPIATEGKAPAKPARKPRVAQDAAKPAGKIDGKDVTADEMAVYDALAKVEPRLSQGAAASFTRARAEAGLSKEAFDKAAASLADKEILSPHYHDFPQSLSPAERAGLVQAGGSDYIGAALRKPGATVERAAQPAGRKPRVKGSVGKLPNETESGTTLGGGLGALQGMGKLFRRDTAPPKGAELDAWADQLSRAIPESLSDAAVARLDDVVNRAMDAAEAGNAREWQRLSQQAKRMVFTPKQRAMAEVSGVTNATRSLMASGDLSAPLRQGALLTLPPSQWGRAGRAAKRMLQSISAGKYEQLKQDIQRHPDFDAAEEAGLHFGSLDTNTKGRGEEDFLRNDSLASHIVERLPILAHSERAYKMYLDSLRMDTFAKYKQVIEKGGGTPEQKERAIKAAAEWINISTGRGSLGEGFDKAVPMLSTIFFAPRYTASRIQILNPATYAKNLGNPAARQVFRRQMSELFQSAAVLSTTAALAKYGLGATVNVDDPDSPDWLKIKIGNTRYDAGAGLQQIARLGVRMAKYLDTSVRGSEGEQGRASNKMVQAAKTLGRSKLGPVPSFFVDWLNNWTNVVGERHTPGERSVKNPILQRVTPLVWADMVEAYQTGGASKAAKFTPGIFGVGVQDYEVNKARKATSRRPASRPPLPPPQARKKGFGDL